MSGDGFSRFRSRTTSTVSVMVINHAHDHYLLRCRSRHRARVLPYRISLEYIASSSLRAAGLASFCPIAAKRLDDVRCHDAMTNMELNVGAMQRRVRSGRAFRPGKTL